MVGREGGAGGFVDPRGDPEFFGGDEVEDGGAGVDDIAGMAVAADDEAGEGRDEARVREEFLLEGDLTLGGGLGLDGFGDGGAAAGDVGLGDAELFGGFVAVGFGGAAAFDQRDGAGVVEARAVEHGLRAGFVGADAGDGRGGGGAGGLGGFEVTAGFGIVEGGEELAGGDAVTLVDGDGGEAAGDARSERGGETRFERAGAHCFAGDVGGGDGVPNAGHRGEAHPVNDDGGNHGEQQPF